MANDDSPSPFAQAFLDDFFAESDEHLTAIRRHLLALEAALPTGTVRRSAIEEMLRSIHSLKGISGMVGLAPAEALAHEMESYLRPLRDGEAVLSAPALDALMDAARILDEVTDALRKGTPGPDISPVQRAIRDLVPLPDRARRRVPVAGTENTDPQNPVGAWRVTFVPSNALLERGVNVNVVRERLRALGEIVEARPVVSESGGVAFEFTVRSTGMDPGVLEAWRADGILAERIETSAMPGLAAGDEPVAAGRPIGGVAAVSRLVRVDLGRLDDVMRDVADMVITRGRLGRAIESVEKDLPPAAFRALQENSLLLERQLRRMRDHVMRVRLVPVREIFSRMPFVVRDLAKDNGKQVKLVLHGQDTEIDKFLIERMMDPILHLVRNAVAHGIEAPTERAERGKPATGVIALHAATVGETVVIEIEDDGAGVDMPSVRRRAEERGLALPAVADPQALLDLLSSSGFSTRDEADRGSGRGVGMGVVKQAVEQLAGTVTMDSRPGQGTKFTLTLPLTLAIIDALLCVVAGQHFAVPQNAVREVLELNVSDIRRLERNEMFPYRGGALPLVRLGTLTHLESPASDRLHVFVIGTGLKAVGLAADRIVGQREIVVRTASDPLLRIEGVAGATELGDGKPVLILDPVALLKAARAGDGGRRDE